MTSIAANTAPSICEMIPCLYNYFVKNRLQLRCTVFQLHNANPFGSTLLIQALMLYPSSSGPHSHCDVWAIIGQNWCQRKQLLLVVNRITKPSFIQVNISILVLTYYIPKIYIYFFDHIRFGNYLSIRLNQPTAAVLCAGSIQAKLKQSPLKLLGVRN